MQASRPRGNYQSTRNALGFCKPKQGLPFNEKAFKDECRGRKLYMGKKIVMWKYCMNVMIPLLMNLVDEIDELLTGTDLRNVKEGHCKGRKCNSNRTLSLWALPSRNSCISLLCSPMGSLMFTKQTISQSQILSMICIPSSLCIPPIPRGSDYKM